MSSNNRCPAEQTNCHELFALQNYDKILTVQNKSAKLFSLDDHSGN